MGKDLRNGNRAEEASEIRDGAHQRWIEETGWMKNEGKGTKKRQRKRETTTIPRNRTEEKNPTEDRRPTEPKGRSNEDIYKGSRNSL